MQKGISILLLDKWQSTSFIDNGVRSNALQHKVNNNYIPYSLFFAVIVVADRVSKHHLDRFV